MRFRDDTAAEQARAAAAVAAWREGHPQGTAEEMVAALGGRFHHDYGPVLRAMLFVADKHRAWEITGITGGGAVR